MEAEGSEMTGSRPEGPAPVLVEVPRLEEEGAVRGQSRPRGVFSESEGETVVRPWVEE